MRQTHRMNLVLIPGLLLLTTLSGRTATGADAADLGKWVSSQEANVLPPDDRKAAANRMGEELRERIKQANEQSSAKWRDLAKLKDAAALAKWRAETVKSLRTSLGAYQTPSEKLEFHVTKTVPGDGYAIENVVFNNGRGLWITANLYRPEPRAKSMPGIMICHSHHQPKVDRELQDMGMTWARMGCLVLVMDQLGYGERREHGFNSAGDYPKEFRVSRQDYWFRYDNSVELHLAGESLIGWMAFDMMRGVDLLLAQDGIDPKRIALFGSVAGGGDPTAVAGAIDERISVVGPFNFGGPQPETRYPLPEDAETWFNYAGSGGWESTRNLRRSIDAAHGTFLPWEIVGSIAPRKLIYGHEFSWDRARDPVWKRFEVIFDTQGAAENLAFAHGTGQIQVNNAEASHCNHIGKIHRVLIHAALSKWWGLPNGVEREYRKQMTDAESAAFRTELLAFTPELKAKLKPATLPARLGTLADERLAAARKASAGVPASNRAVQFRAKLTELLGPVEPTVPATLVGEPKVDVTEGYKSERFSLKVESGFVLPVVLFVPTRTTTDRRPSLVVAVSQSGKEAFLKQRNETIAELLAGGSAVCLPDLRGTGEVRQGDGRDRGSASNSYSSSELMLGGTHVGVKLRDLRAVLGYLRGRKDFDARRLALWGDSFAETNTDATNFRVPHGLDGRAKQSEPLGAMLALLGALYDDQVKAVYASGGLTGFRSVLGSPFVYIPHDVVVPGLLTVGDMTDLVAEVAPRPVRLERLVDGLNRPASFDAVRTAYQPTTARYEQQKSAGKFSLEDDKTPAAKWLLDNLAGK